MIHAHPEIRHLQIQRQALLVTPREFIEPRGPQGTSAASGPREQHPQIPVQKDRGGVLQPLPVLPTNDYAAAARDDALIGSIQSINEDPMLEVPEKVLARGREDVGYRASGAGFDLTVEVHEIPADAPSYGAPDGALTTAHIADEGDGSPQRSQPGPAAALLDAPRVVIVRRPYVRDVVGAELFKESLGQHDGDH